MSATTLVNALRRHREGLASRWCKRFADNRAGANSQEVGLADGLTLALVDEVISLLATEGQSNIPRRHQGRAFSEMAPFPGNVAICIDCFQAGAQVIGAFIVEHAGPFALWSVQERNGFLGELDAVFHILVHREIEAVCEHRLDAPASPESAVRRVRAQVGLREFSPDVISNN